jgi:predicted MFS family arabinose efflux permease
LLVLVRRRGRLSPVAERHLVRELREGAKLALHSPTLRLLVVFVVITGIGEAVMGTLMAPFVRDVLRGDAQTYGLILSSQAAGGIVGGLVVAAVAKRFEPRRLVGYGALAFGLLDLVLFLYPLLVRAIWPAIAIMVVVGLPGALTMAGLLTVFQRATGDAHRGRIFGLATAIEGAAMLAGALGAGALGNRLGIVPVIAVQGVGYCVAGALMLAFLRSLEIGPGVEVGDEPGLDRLPAEQFPGHGAGGGRVHAKEPPDPAEVVGGPVGRDGGDR